MFHVSFLVKEGKAKIFLENGLAVIKPVKPKRAGHSAAAREDDVKNQVTKYMWIKFGKTILYTIYINCDLNVQKFSLGKLISHKDL